MDASPRDDRLPPRPPLRAASRGRRGPEALRTALASLLAIGLAGCEPAQPPEPAETGVQAPIGQRGEPERGGTAGAETADGETAAATAADGPRLVLLYAPCSVARAHLSPYAPEVDYTPALERFAGAGRVFQRHHTEAGLSGVAYAALVSGRSVLGHGVYAHPQFLDDDLLLIGEAFAAAGYQGYFFDVHTMATEALNYTQGIPALNRRHRPMRADDRYFRRALRRLREDPEARAFLVATFLDTHWPYRAEDLDGFCRAHPAACGSVPSQDAEERAAHLALYEEHRMELSYDFAPTARALGLEGERLARFADLVEALYASSVARMDAHFGAVLEAIDEAGLRDDSLIAFTTDHGEQMWREGALFPWTHGHTLEREVIEIPWLLRGAGLGPGTYPAVTRSIDVYPTLAGLAGVPVPAEAELEGVDLAPALRGEASPPELPAWFHTAVVRGNLFTEAPGWETFFTLYPRADPSLMWVGIREGDRVFKLRHRGDGVFAVAAFDWAEDPHERRDLFDATDPHHAVMAERLRARRAALEDDYDRRGKGGDQLVSDAQKRELLRQLGYVR